MFFNLLSSYAIDTFEPIAKWATIGVIAALIVAGIFVFLLKRDEFNKFVKRALFGLLVFLLAVGIAGLIMEIAKSFNPNYVEENYMDRQAVTKYIFIPVTGLLILFLATAVAIGIAIKKSSPENAKTNVKKP